MAGCLVRCIFVTAACIAAQGQKVPVTLPVGTQLPVSIPGNLPMKAGERIRAELLYPVYCGDQLALPAGTVVTGAVVSLSPDHGRRVRSRLRADFTPFHTPVVQFDSIVEADGSAIPIQTGTATDGAPIYRLVAPPPRKGGCFRQHFEDAKEFAGDRVRVVTGPDKEDRLKQLLYSQLPYHPEEIAKGTAWTAETVAPVTFTPEPVPAKASAAPAPLAAKPGSEGPATWVLEGYLDTGMSSATSKAGQMIHATVAEPVRNPDGSVAVPQGSVLTGTVTSAKPARRMARDGQLRFSFRQLTLPGGQPESVRASLKGADSPSASQLAMDSEGEVKPKPQDKVVVPLLLIVLAGRPLDRDGGANQLGKDAAGSNSLGLIGFIVGTAAQQPYLAAGLGYYGAALAIWNRIFARGKEVAFAKDTRVEIQTTGTRSGALRAGATQP